MGGRKIDERDAYVIYKVGLEYGYKIGIWLCNLMGYCERSYWNIHRQRGRVNFVLPRRMKTKWNISEMNMAAHILANNATLTLQEIIDDYVLHGFVNISPSTLFRYLTINCNISRKKLTRWGQYRNKYIVKIERIYFFNRLFYLNSINSNIVWIDEFSLNLQITRNYGRAEVGERAVYLLPQNPGINISVCLAVDRDGLIYYEDSIDSFNSESFEIFLSNLYVEIPQFKKNNGIFIFCDNAPPHTEKVFNDFLMYSNFDGDFLPAYSPMLTPIEESISLIKNECRNLLDTDLRIKLLNLINVPRGQKLKEMEKFLKGAIAQAMTCLTNVQMTSYINHVYSFASHVYNMEDI